MSSGGKQRAQNQADQTYWNNASKSAYDATAQASPLQQKYEQSQMDFLNWDSSNGKNVADAPGMDAYVQIGRAAQARANQDRMGSGALALSDGGASGYAEKLKSLRQAQTGEMVGTGLEEALAGRRAEATNSVVPLASLNQQRLLGRQQYAGGMLNSSYQRPRVKSWWDYVKEGGQLAAQLAQGAGAAMTGAAA